MQKFKRDFALRQFQATPGSLVRTTLLNVSDGRERDRCDTERRKIKRRRRWRQAILSIDQLLGRWQRGSGKRGTRMLGWKTRDAILMTLFYLRKC